jgi:arylsulfatase A-like enzyme
MRAVDRGIATIVRALRSEHELDNTAIVFTSDNGWLQGEHRVPGRKVDPYEESLHVPFVVRLPKAMRRRHGAPRSLSTTVANVDVAPTLLQIAGTKPCSHPGHCRVLDGRSLLRAIRSDGRRWPRNRAILLELRTPSNRAMPYTPCNYQGIRTARQVYVEYHSWTAADQGACTRKEEVEHYDLRADPFELQNLFPAPAGTVRASQERELAARLARLEDCAGISGRDPRPASGHYCD